MKQGLSWVAFAIMGTLVPTVSGAGEKVSFSEVWRKVEAGSPSRKAAEQELETARVAAERSGRHWFPMLYLDGRVYNTNDPGLSLFSTLAQRQMAPTDFSPDRLNHPDGLTYGKATVGMGWSLFEGGLRVSQRSAAEKMKAAREMQVGATRVQIYAEAARVYGTVAAEEQKRRELESLDEALDQVITRYRIGAKENPVGYSGLLGLRSVKNRVSGAIAENSAKTGALRDALDKMATGLPDGWQPEMESVEAYARRYLAVKEVPRAGSSYQVESYALMAEAAREARGAELAKFLPRVGLFAEGNLNRGNRDTATSYVAGGYLQWDLFVAPNIGAVKQAESAAAAAEARADEARLHESIQSEGSRQAALALETNLKVLQDSSALLSEQTDVAKKLFLNGSMNALQLAEVLNRRLDLIVSFAQAKAEYLAMRATLVKNSKGVSHE